MPNAAQDTLPLIAYLNSGVVRAFIRDTCGLHKQSGAIGRIPVPLWDADTYNALTKAAIRLVRLASETYSFDETSRNFLAPASMLNPLGIEGDTESEIAAVVGEIDRVCRSLFGISSADFEWLMPTAIPSQFEPLSIDMTSWAVGVAFARFDIRIATGERPSPPKPDPFDRIAGQKPRNASRWRCSVQSVPGDS